MQANIKDTMAPKVAHSCLMVQKCHHSTMLTPIVSLRFDQANIQRTVNTMPQTNMHL